MSKIELIEKLACLLAEKEGFQPPSRTLLDSPHPRVKRWLVTSQEALELIQDFLEADELTFDDLEVKENYVMPQASNAPLTSKKKQNTPKNLFQDRHNGDKLYQQFNTVKAELASLPGITFGKLRSNQDNFKAWFLTWNGLPAMLYWTVGNGWEVGAREYEQELKGDWEGFDLMEHLANNNVNTEDWG